MAEKSFRINYDDQPGDCGASILNELGITYETVGGDGWIELKCADFPDIKTLNEENAEYRKILLEMKKQIEDMYVFNNKLILVTKVIRSNKFSDEEQMELMKQFDATNTIQEAKELYDKVLSEKNAKEDNLD